MARQNVHYQEMSLLLSGDAKPRLKWTPELHQRFIDAVNQLGALRVKATPKSLMRMMGIHGLTLYHLKSHLQKYRLGRSQQAQNHHHDKQEDNGENQRSHSTNKADNGAKEQINESLQVARALQMQMEVQRKLHEQIEVQRHLQLRIEAQGKYLQSVLKKAQETLCGYSASSIEVEHAKAQLSQLVSMMDSGCTSSFSVLTESDGSMFNDTKEIPLGLNGESSLTSSESSARKEESQTKHDVDMNHKHGNATGNERKKDSAMLSLMEMNPASNRKRRKSTIREAHHQEKNRGERVQRLRSLEKIDLNCSSLEFEWV